jgi:hypothetical protein
LQVCGNLTLKSQEEEQEEENTRRRRQETTKTIADKRLRTDLFPVLTAYFTTPSSADATTSPIAPYLNRPNAQGSTPLHWAALNGHLPVVKQLVSAGADMWAKNEAGHLAMFEAERADKGDVVQFLLEADVERVGNEGGAVSEEDMRDMEVEETGEEGSGDLKMSMGEKN